MYHLLCMLQAAGFGQPPPVGSGVMDTNCRHLGDSRAREDNRNYMVFYTLHKILHYIHNQFHSMSKRITDQKPSFSPLRIPSQYIHRSNSRDQDALIDYANALDSEDDYMNVDGTETADGHAVERTDETLNHKNSALFQMLAKIRADNEVDYMEYDKDLFSLPYLMDLTNDYNDDKEEKEDANGQDATAFYIV